MFSAAVLGITANLNNGDLTGYTTLQILPQLQAVIFSLVKWKFLEKLQDCSR